MPTTVTTRPRGRTLLIAAGAITGVLIAGGAWWAEDGPARPAQAEPVVTSSAPAATPMPSASSATPQRTVRQVSVVRERTDPATAKPPAGPGKAAKTPKPPKPPKHHKK